MSASPSSVGNLDPGGPLPSLRTISLDKNVWEKETAYLKRAHLAEPGACPHTTLSYEQEPAAQPSEADDSSTPVRFTSIVGLPMLSCRTKSYSCWALVVLILDLSYSAFLLPISVGMQVNDLEFTWACWLDLSVGLFFAAELVLGFHVGFVATSSGRKREVMDGNHVAKYYVRHGSFVQDLLSTLIWVTQILLLILQQSGVNMPSTVNAFQVVRIVRMVRFITILRSMFSLTISSGSSSILPGLKFSSSATHVINILYALLVLVNFFGCVWNFIAIKEGYENTWMNTVQQLIRQYSADGMSILTPEELAAIPGARRWLTGFYFSLVTVATLGFGDIVPSTAAETAVVCVVVAVGVLLFGIIMGSIAEQVSNSSREARQAQIYREKMATVHAWMRSSNMPKPLKAKINSFYAEVWVRHASFGDTSQMFFELPHKLRQELAWEMNRAAMEELPFFARVDETIRFVLASFMSPVELTPGQELCLRGEMADRFWILLEGEVQVINEYDTVRTIHSPALLGESALLQHSDNKYCVRPHGYRSGTGCSLWEVHLRDLMPFLLAHPEVLDSLTACARGRLTRESMVSVAIMSGDGLAGRGRVLWPSASLDDYKSSGELKDGEVFSAQLAQWGEAGSPSASVSRPGSPAGGGHTCFEFGVESQAGTVDVAGGEEEEVQLGMHSFTGACSIQLTADARGEPLCSPFDSAAKPGYQEQLAGQDPTAPVTRDELLQAIELLREDVIGRLTDMSLDLRRAVRNSNAHAAMPMWTAAAADRRRTTRQLSERHMSRHLSPASSPASSGGLKWNFSQFS